MASRVPMQGHMFTYIEGYTQGRVYLRNLRFRVLKLGARIFAYIHTYIHTYMVL